MPGDDRLENLDAKRKRFEEAGKFPVRKVVLIAVVAAVVLFGGAYGYQRYQQSRQIGGVVVMPGVRYPTSQIEMTVLKEGVAQTAEGISFPLQDLKTKFIVGFTYKRRSPMPKGYQLAAGGNILPLMAYVAPSGRLVVATSFCEPCRSTRFHFEGNALVCDVCFTRWDLNTLLGIGGGCFDYPPQERPAELRGDTVFIPDDQLEAWVPRAYETVKLKPGMSVAPTPQ